MCRSLRGKIYPIESADLSPPHQSLTRQLPPKGKPFCKPSFALHNKATVYLPAIYSLFKVVFAMYARRKEGFPLGGSCRVSD